MLLLAAYQLYGKTAETDAEQEQLSQRIEQQWAAELPENKRDGAPLPGAASSRLYIPPLDLDWVVVEGVTQQDIKHAPGHYPDSAGPGDVGNYAVAGHRAPGMFWDLDRLAVGDELILEDRTRFYTYAVTESRVVTPDKTEVVDPDPENPGAEPTTAMLTLTTCWPKFDNTHRLVIFAELTETRDKSDGRPSAISE